MAKADMGRLISYLKGRMKEDSATYRKEIANKKAHYITVSVAQIKKQVKIELVQRGAVTPATGKLSEGISKIVDEQVPILCEGLYNDFKAYNNSPGKHTYVSDLIGSKTLFTFVLAQVEGKSNASVFNAFRTIKQENQRPLLRKIRAQITKLNKSRGEKNQIKKPGKNFLDIGHEEGSSVAAQRAGSVRAGVKGKLEGYYDTKMNAKGKKVLDSLISDLQWKINKYNGQDRDTLNVSLESSRINKQRGGSKEKDMVLDLNKDLKKIIESLDPSFWANQKGSDSKLSKSKKRVLNTLTQKAFKSNKIKSTIKPQKINDTDSSTSSRSKKPKLSAATSFKEEDTFDVGVVGAKSSPASLFSFVALINKKLPQTVAKNMGFPAMDNQTGRFASSVKIQDVNRTKQGHPSFGYTYAKNPYQVFEVGKGQAPWATSDRDPRKLIDGSIREVAASLALGRFYTRRL